MRTFTGRIYKHPSDSGFLLLQTPYDLRSETGRLGFATYSADYKAYLFPTEHLDKVQVWAKQVNLRLVDERGGFKPATEAAAQPQECRYCTQPGMYTSPPRICPSCGQHWEAVTPKDLGAGFAGYSPQTQCAECGHWQGGRFRYCTNCGTPMDYPTFSSASQQYSDFLTELQRRFPNSRVGQEVSE